MAKSKQTKKSKDIIKESKPLFDDLSPHAKQAILAVLVAVIGVFFAASLFNLGGWLGSWAEWGLTQLFGAGEYLAPLVCAFYVYALLNPRDNDTVSISKVLGIALLFFALLGVLQLAGSIEMATSDWGGLAGIALLWPLSFLFGNTVAGVMLFGLVLISFFLIFNTGLRMPKFGREDILDDEADIQNLVIPGEHGDGLSNDN